MSHFNGPAAVAAGLALSLVALAGCGSSDDTSAADSPTSTPTTGADSPDGGDTPAETGDVTEKGSITINGTEFAVTMLNRCDPTGASFDLDLQALGQGVKINLYGADGEIQDVSVDGSQVKAQFGSIAFGADPAISASTVTEDRTTGTATVGDSTGSGSTVDITWDVMVPAETLDCSL